MILRQIKEEDAERFLELRDRLDEETKFMMLEPGERTVTIKEQQGQINEILSKENQKIFVVEDKNQLVGFLQAFGGRYKKNKHSVYIVMGILKVYSRKGIGTKLFGKLEKWAKQNKIHRLELFVMIHNKAAIALYKKMGFKTEGTKKHSLLVDGLWIDEYCMAKLLF